MSCMNVTCHVGRYTSAFGMVLLWHFCTILINEISFIWTLNLDSDKRQRDIFMLSASTMLKTQKICALRNVCHLTSSTVAWIFGTSRASGKITYSPCVPAASTATVLCSQAAEHTSILRSSCACNHVPGPFTPAHFTTCGAGMCGAGAGVVPAHGAAR